MQRVTNNMRTLLLFFLLLLPAITTAQQVNRQKLAAEVKAEFLHAWNGYKKYAWGHDDLKPLSKTHHDWYPQPLLMTPVDSLDTMILMGMDDEAAATRQYIARQSLVRQRHRGPKLRDHDSTAGWIAQHLPTHSATNAF